MEMMTLPEISAGAQLIQQIGAHDPDELRGTGKSKNHRGQGKMLQKVDEFCPTPGREHEGFREQPAYVGAKPLEGEIHDEQRQQEIRHGDADEAQHGEDIVTEGILADRRIDANRQSQNPGDDQGHEGQRQREPDTIADYLGHGTPPFH
jgi:hypothetical protein